MKVRTTVMLDEVVLCKIKSDSDSVSAFVNSALKKVLFGKRDSMLGALKGKVSGADKVEDGE